jgi:hypothetical protein
MQKVTEILSFRTYSYAPIQLEVSADPQSDSIGKVIPVQAVEALRVARG